jgi:hypothetical protein
MLYIDCLLLRLFTCLSAQDSDLSLKVFDCDLLTVSFDPLNTVEV